MITEPPILAEICIFQGKWPFHTIYWGSFALPAVGIGSSPLSQPWLMVSLSAALSSGAGVQVCREHAWQRGAGP